MNELNDDYGHVFLIELHGDPVTFPVYKEEGAQVEYKGMKVCRIIDRDCEIIATYDALNDKMDISALTCFPETKIVLVGSVDGKNLSWITANVDAANDERTEIILSHKRLCSAEEVAYLDEIFPHYFLSCSLEGSPK